MVSGSGTRWKGGQGGIRGRRRGSRRLEMQRGGRSDAIESCHSCSTIIHHKYEEVENANNLHRITRNTMNRNSCIVFCVNDSSLFSSFSFPSNIVPMLCCTLLERQLHYDFMISIPPRARTCVPTIRLSTAIPDQWWWCRFGATRKRSSFRSARRQDFRDLKVCIQLLMPCRLRWNDRKVKTSAPIVAHLKNIGWVVERDVKSHRCHEISRFLESWGVRSYFRS